MVALLFFLFSFIFADKEGNALMREFTYVVPANVVKLKIDMAGAQGGNGQAGPASETCQPPLGGLGGRITADIAVNPNAFLYVRVGGEGRSNDDCYASCDGEVGGGGHNGGGSSLACRGAGGGASDIRTSYTEKLTSRILVAGGGGGGGKYSATGGAGGSLDGADGVSAGNCRAAGGGVQTHGGAAANSSYDSYRYCSEYGAESGSFGLGGNGYYGGGGGSGYYGGAGDGSNGGGGGGSNYCCGSPVCSRCVHEQGVQRGNGYVNISINSCSSGYVLNSRACVLATPLSNPSLSPSTSLVVCSPGFHPIGSGSNPCQPCNAGQYGIDGLHCIDCPLGTINTATLHATACTLCPENTYEQDRNNCQPCGLGLVSSRGSSKKSDCNTPIPSFSPVRPCVPTLSPTSISTSMIPTNVASVPSAMPTVTPASAMPTVTPALAMPSVTPSSAIPSASVSSMSPTMIPTAEASQHSIHRWSEVSVLPRDCYNAVALSENGQNMAAVACMGGRVWISHDFGYSWSNSTQGENWSGIAMSSSGQHVYLVSNAGGGADSGNMYISRDYGSSWEKVRAVFSAVYFSSVSSDSSGQHVAATVNVGDATGIWLSFDYGRSESWSLADVPQALWTSIAISDDGQYLAAVSCTACGTQVAAAGYICTSSDYGRTFQQRIKSRENYHAITSDYTGKYLVAAAYGGRIFFSSDFGTQWHVASTQPPDNFYRALSASSNCEVVFASVADKNKVYYGSIYVSTDCGQSWNQSLTPPAPGKFFNSIAVAKSGTMAISTAHGDHIYLWGSPQSTAPTIYVTEVPTLQPLSLSAQPSLQPTASHSSTYANSFVMVYTVSLGIMGGILVVVFVLDRCCCQGRYYNRRYNYDPIEDPDDVLCRDLKRIL